MNECPLCNHTEIKPNGWATENIAYHQCIKCGFIFIPRPIPFSTKDIYDASYATLRGHALINSAIHKSKLKTAEWYFKKIASYKRIETMLDVGCSTGANAAQACALGWKASGMDINTAALSTARSYLPQVAFYKTLDTPELMDKKFDLVTLFDVIEHIEDLHSFIAEIRSLLAADGLLFILTPDVRSLSAKILNNQWPHLFREHISLFTKKNLITFLQQNNFRVLEAGFALKFVSLEGLYRHVTCHCQGTFAQVIKIIMTPVQKIPWVIPFNIGESYVIARTP